MVGRLPLRALQGRLGAHGVSVSVADSYSDAIPTEEPAVTDPRPLHRRLSPDDYDAVKRAARHHAVQLRNEAIAAATDGLVTAIRRLLRRLSPSRARRSTRLQEI
jgi:hypothetical protein